MYTGPLCVYFAHEILSMKVLIIDSSIEIIERLQQALCETEEVTAAYGAVAYKDGFAFFKDVKPSLVLLDSGLAGGESVRLLQDIKKMSRQTPVVIMHSGAGGSWQPEDDFAGADLFFDKYHDFEKLPGVVSVIAGEMKEVTSDGML